MICKRCFNRNRLLFKRINCSNCKQCYYCLKCAHLSIFKICDTITNQLDFHFLPIDYTCNYKLTKAQQQVSNDLLKYINKQSVLISAVCGAGKTEILFEFVKWAVNKQDKVCYCSPRIEVVKAIYARFCHSFNYEFGLLLSKQVITNRAMYFCTTHQLIKYQKQFDYVIVDEVDAFPLVNDKILQNGIKNSLVAGGKVIYVSATPFKVNKNFVTLTLNERYHGYPLIVPQFIKYSLVKLQALITSNNWLVFFPTIKLLNEVKQILNNPKIIVCHSKVDDLSNRLANLTTDFIIFSTAILERGVTFANINVIVMAANHHNYTTSTLIQISGRVGRVVPYIDGQLYFMSEIISLSMQKARKYFVQINE